MVEENGSSQAVSYDRDAIANAMLGKGPKDDAGQPVPVQLTTPQATTTTAPVVETQVPTEEILEESPIADQQPGTTPEVTPEVLPDADPVPYELPELDELDVVGLLQEADIPVNNLDEIREALALKEKYTATQKEFTGLSEDEKRRIAVGREFGDFNVYDRVMAINADLLPEKEILRQVFFLEQHGNKQSLEFLSKQFDRNYKKDYEDDEDEDYSKMKLTEDVRLARDAMKEMQEVLKSKTLGSTVEDTIEDDSEERQQAWASNVTKTIESIDRFAYELDGNQISIAVDPATVGTVEQAMLDPIGFINELITDDKGNVDHEALMEFIVRNIYFESILKEAKETGKATFQETQLKQLQNKVDPKVNMKMAEPNKPTAKDAFVDHIQKFR